LSAIRRAVDRGGRLPSTLEADLMTRRILGTALVGLWLVTFVPAMSVSARANDRDDRSTVSPDAEDSWYYQPATQPSTEYRPNPRAIIHQKAQANAQQRQSRMSAMNWYGMSNSRPTAAPTPFTSIYSPVWQAPGVRPFVWYTSGRPTFVFR
jgi:hypothetical protein